MISILRWVIRKILARLDPDAKLLRQIQDYTLCSAGTLKNLRRLATFINGRDIEGDFVECGTYKGGSAAMLGTVLTPERHLWLYDSFQGLPDTKPIDGEDAQEKVGSCVASEEDVIQVLTSVGLSSRQYTIRKGWFDQTFRQPLPRQVALLHCDADWYDSVLIVLETFYPLIPEGGCIILDDFGYWEGCREAFYDYCFKHGEKPLLERLGSTQAYWIKGKANNR